MKIKEIEQKIEDKIIDGISALTDIINFIDDENLTPEETVKSIKYAIDCLLENFNNTFRMSKNNRYIAYPRQISGLCGIEELKTLMAEYIIQKHENTLCYHVDDESRQYINDLFKDFE
jgi:hypothetical protein